MEVVSEKCISMSEAKVLLEKRKKDSELSYEQQNALEHAEKFAKLTENETEKMRKALEEMNILNEKQINEIIDILPAKEDVLRSVLSKERLDFTGDQLKEIMKTVKKFAK